MRLMTTSGISDQTSPDSTKIGGWLFRHRTAIPVPFALALLLLRVGEAPFSWTLVAAGVVLTTAGEWLRLAAVMHIGVISRTRRERLGPLVTTGPFGFVRNPLYIGNALIWVGFALTSRLVWAAPLVGVLIIAEYHEIVRWEERLLESRFGDAYRDYAASVPRWIPRAAPLRTRVEPNPDPRAISHFPWRETLFSERGTLIAIGVGYALLWTKARF
jgi:protein-S-isoprenylcysteine O-methyltransferase Ste14